MASPEGWPVYTARPWPSGVIEAVYDYTDATGAGLFQVVRFQPKSFLTRRLLAGGEVSWGLRGVTPVLFRLPQVMAATTVVLLEGEKDVQTAERLGLPPGWAATCNPFGACMWRPEYSAALAGKALVFCPDTDLYGEVHLHEVACATRVHAASMAIVRLPPAVKDLTEWAQAGGDGPGFAALLAQAAPLVYPRPDSDRLRVTGPVAGALDRLLALRGVRGVAQGAPAGWVAEAVADIFPNWVGRHADGTAFVAVSGFEPLLVTALRDLRQAGADVQPRLAALEALLQAQVSTAGT